jgi:hypothetical protein
MSLKGALAVMPTAPPPNEKCSELSQLSQLSQLGEHHADDQLGTTGPTQKPTRKTQ